MPALRTRFQTETDMSRWASRVLHRTCADCSGPFTLTSEDIAEVDRQRELQPQRRWSLPTRCAACIAARTSQQRVIASHVDRTLTCRQCSKRWTWTVRDQAFYARQQWVEPLRCRVCRTGSETASLGAPRPQGEPPGKREIPGGNAAQHRPKV